MTGPAAPTIERIAPRIGEIAYEARLHYPEASALRGGVAIAPPHPFLGGDFDNNVVLHLASELAAAGWAVLTYNLPGVGATPARSGGGPSREAFWEDPRFDEAARRDARDFAALAGWLAATTGLEPGSLHAAGYSYGAGLAMLAAETRRFAGLAMISAPLPQIPPSSLGRIPGDALMIFAEDDLSLGGRDPREFIPAGPEAPAIEILAGADHFFIDRLDALARRVVNYVAGAEEA